jgi:hypothetical protein
MTCFGTRAEVVLHQVGGMLELGATDKAVVRVASEAARFDSTAGGSFKSIIASSRARKKSSVAIGSGPQTITTCHPLGNR